MSSTLIGFKATPVPRKGVDVMSMPLSSTEGYLYSRLDGVMNVEEICAAMSLDQEEVSAILHKLCELGAIDVNEPSAAKPAEATKPPDSKPADKKSEETEGDLSLEMRREIMGMRLHVEQANFYQMLGAPPDADRNDLRKAYFDLSRKYHPDSYYGKDLGRYRPMMEFIFAKLSEAYTVLSRKKTRAEYDEYIADQILAYEMEKSLGVGALTGDGPGEAATAPQQAGASQDAALAVFQFEAVPAGAHKAAPWAAAARAQARGEARVALDEGAAQPMDAAVATKYQPRFSPEILKQVEALVPRQATEPRVPTAEKVSFPKPRPRPRAEPAAAGGPIATPGPQAPAKAPTSLPLTPPKPAARPAPQAPAAPKLAPESAAVRRLREQRSKLAVQALMKGQRTIEAIQRPPPQVQPQPVDPLEQYGLDLTLDRPLPGARAEEVLAFQFTGAALDALRLEDVPTAVSMLERAAELDPNNRQVAEALEKVRAKAKGSLAGAFERQGNYEEQTGKYAQAANSFLKALGYKADDHRLMVKAAGALLRSEGDLKRARGLARRAVGLKPEKVEYRVALAEIYIRLGMGPEALEELEVAHRLDPKNERVIRLLRGIERQE